MTYKIPIKLKLNEKEIKKFKEEREKKPIKRKVVCVFGKWGKDTDFVIEPICSNPECEYCKEGFWIQECEE